MTLTATARFHIALKTQSLPTKFSNLSGSIQVGVSTINSKITKSISKNMLVWRTLFWDLGRKVMVDVIENDNEDTHQELCEIFLSIQKKLQPSIIVDK
ncbi:3889_t:CDS:2 [Funneliformis mosseae]|uniref:3889_t:CDS:1 n=1 Tax=Funneliformis mosseae TaxID=27381 RepID=A0A9N9HCZ7_FUNMO|nr:3889_t:CDS:2 [Funneliformis mosseae]